MNRAPELVLPAAGDEFTPEPSEGSSSSIFQGPFDLRAGWSIALWAVVVAVVASLVLALVSLLPSSARGLLAIRGEAGPLAVGVGEAQLLLALAVASAALSRLEHRPIAAYGLGRRHVADVLPGLGAGLLLLSALVLTLVVTHHLFFDAELLHGGPAVRSGASWAVAFLLVGMFEEYAFRGYLQFALTRGLYGLGWRLSPRHAQRTAFWCAAVLLSLLFAATHLQNHGENWTGITAVFVAGLVFSYALWRTGSLWWGIGFHTAWDWAETFLYGVPDSGQMGAGRLFTTHASGNALLSGGHAGPEGSIFVLPALLLVVAVLQLKRGAAQPALSPATDR